MEIKGRQCEEVKVGEDKLYFLTSFKGKEYRKVQTIQFGNSATVSGDGDVQINAGKLIASIDELFSVFCLDIVKGEEHINVDTDYLDELSVENYVIIQGKVTDKLNELLGSKKA